MTRAERIAALLAVSLNHRMALPMSDAWYLELTSHILTLADDVEFLTVGDFAEIIDRNKTTLINWYLRGKNEIPEPVGRTHNGAIWTSEQITAWKDAHPHLCGPDAG